jgi:hypothetical protein
MPGGGEFGQDRFGGGAGFGCDPAAQRRHAVGMLVAQGDAAACGAVVVAELAVGVEVGGDAVGDLGQCVGPKLAGMPGQIVFGGVAGGGVDPAGQPLDESADDGDVGGPDVAGALGGAGGG